jgi:hypothetical protein
VHIDTFLVGLCEKMGLKPKICCEGKINTKYLLNRKLFELFDKKVRNYLNPSLLVCTNVVTREAI